jgi:phenylalanine-4-hydroxylase
MADFEHVFDTPPEGAAADWTISQNWRAYTEVEHDTWDTLYARQMEILPGRASEAFMKGLGALNLNTGGIPDFALMNPKLKALTGWTVVCVPGLVPDDVFFDHLANRRFPSGQFIRKPDQLDYLQEPDIFHDVFGHVPMLTDPSFADYMQAYGKGGQRAQGLGMLKNLARLYWYTVEFGLIEEAGACASTARASSRRRPRACSRSKTRRPTASPSIWSGSCGRTTASTTSSRSISPSPRLRP